MRKKTRTSKPKRPERLSGIQNAKDRSETLEALFRAFADPGWMERHVQSLWASPIFDPEHRRITVAECRGVSAVVMGPRAIRFGPVAVPAMTLGPVGPHDKYRKNGYAAAAMNDASKYMADNGILLAYLQGISNFYRRFGGLEPVCR